MPSGSDMRHPASQALYAYWNDVRGGRRAPRRLEIQPARIGDLLLDTFILERVGQSAFRFRLAGTRVAARFGLELKNRDFLACWGEGDRALLEHHLAGIVDLGRVGVLTGEAELAAGPEDSHFPARCPFELVILPLVHTGHAIDRLLCHMVALEPDRIVPGTGIARLRLLAAESVWPNSGFTTAPDASADRQLPLHPNVRTARIVRQGRRQFRVYEGGLSADGGTPGERI